jgi:hypothetical protein
MACPASVEWPNAAEPGALTNRDTAWFAMIDRDWPRLKAGYEARLQPNNFDENKQQKSKLTL